MDQATHDKVMIYLRTQLSQAEARLKSYTVDRNGKPLLRRSAVLSLEKYIRDFTVKGKEPRWIAVPGLRGAGKTTLLAQIYTQLNCAPNHKLYVSLDEAKRVLGVSLNDILTVYEELLSEPFESLNDNVYLFIDEVQYDDDWGVVLKSHYDRSKKIFIFCTGSSALALRLNPDVSRRLTLERLYPLSFTEYILIKHGQMPIKGLGTSIRQALYESADAEEVYGRLTALKRSAQRYWANVHRLELDMYLRYGSLPFTLQYTQEPIIYEQVEHTLSSVINKDVAQLGKFDQITLGKIQQILYALANHSVTSLGTLGKMHNLAVNTVIDALNVLEQSEVLLRVYPYGAAGTHAKKPSKYLFLSPAYRSMFFNLIGSGQPYDQYKGLLWEDAVGMQLHRMLGGRMGAALTYDSTETGADFITTSGSNQIAIEVGYGTKGFNQAEGTLARYGGAYGLSISSSPLSINSSKTVVKVPFSYFLLT